MREKAQAVLHVHSAQNEGCTAQIKRHAASIAVANLKKTSFSICEDRAFLTRPPENIRLKLI